MAKSILSFKIRSMEDMIQAVKDTGILPLFENSIPGFSIEEHVAPRAWFSGEEGIWEWKGPVIQKGKLAYGKFFERKAVFMTREWFYDFANYRRDGYDFDARFDDGLAQLRDKELYDLINGNAPILSRDLKRVGNYKKGGKKGFDTIVTRLQAQGYVIVNDFVYLKDRYGEVYGWGVAEYTTPERFFGKPFLNNVYKRSPEQSRARILKHLKSLFPDVTEETLLKFTG